MATLTAVSQLDQQRLHMSSAERQPALGVAVSAGLAALAILVHGYHPYADDGGIYVAGVKRLLNPALYPHDAAFVLEPSRFSLFARTMWGLVHACHLPLASVLLVVQFLSIWTTLFAGWLVAACCWPSVPARLGSAGLLACWLTLPVAGTALVLIDPYVTARSLSTPLTVMALSAAMSMRDPARHARLRGGILCTATVGVAALMHPLMTGYAAFGILLLIALQSDRPKQRIWIPAATCASAVAAASAAQLLAPTESGAALAAGLSRTFWFPSEWKPYELLGIVAPLMILAGYARSPRRQRQPAAVLACACTLLGSTSLAVAVLFAREHAASFVVARLQPLRAFHLVYLVMAIVLGAELGQRLLRRNAVQWIAAYAVLCAPMYLVQRGTYRQSPHLEFQPFQSRNNWVQAFLWARDNTPNDAMFALDSDYITAAGEDTQSFRAIAERSSLSDFSNDGGEASIAPGLASAWLAGIAAQKGLDRPNAVPEQADAIRRANLAGTGADWLILHAGSPTDLPCPYANASVKVCKVASK